MNSYGFFIDDGVIIKVWVVYHLAVLRLLKGAGA